MKKVFSSFLCLMFIFQQTMFLPALATDITGVAGAGNVYNVDPTSMSGSTGFRSYTNFNLSQGDIANLIFKYGANDVSKFVNLVDNTININGIVNSMRDGNFYNGHAIFVSPNGMVVGSSGVINVGALSILTPTQSSFNSFKSSPIEDLTALKDAGTGVVTINGKIFARDGVDIRGKSVTVENTAGQKAGIFAGIDNNTYNSVITTETQAENLFASLVNTKGLNKGTGFANENGKIVIKAQYKAENVSTSADTKASVKVSNAYLDGNGIDIDAKSEVTYNKKTGEVENIATDILNNLDGIINGTYTGFVGSVAQAVVEITSGAELVSNENVNLSSQAKAKVEISPEDASDKAEGLLYSIGTQTVSKVEVKSGASIKTPKDVNIAAVSLNDSKIKLTTKNDPTKSDESSMQLLMLANWAKADTQATVASGSELKAANLAVNAVNATKQDVKVETESVFGENESTVNLGVAAVLNKTDINTVASVDTQVDTSNAGNVSVNAQSLYQGETEVSAGSKGNGEAVDDPDSPTPGDNADTQPTAGEKTQKEGMLSKLKGLINGSSDKNKEETSGGGTSSVQTVASVSGSAIVNLGKVNTKAEVGNNATINADNLTINANSVDLTINNATTSSENGKFAPGAAVIVNKQDNETIAQIKDGTSSQKANITADNLKINATAEMPMNRKTLDFLISFKDGVSEAAKSPFSEDFWSNGFIKNVQDFGSQIKDIKADFDDSGVGSSFGIPGWFNNYAQSAGSGETVGLAGSVIYSDVANNTVARIGDYSQVSGGDVIVNAANDVVYNNMSGVLDSFKDVGSGFGGKVGLGGALILSFDEHNAKAQIGDNAYLNNTGDVSLGAATSQTHANVAAGGGKAETAAIMGSIAVVSVSGTTETSVGDSDIRAKSLTMNAGKAKIKSIARDASNDNEIKGYDEGNSSIEMNTSESEITDKTRLVTITGSYAKQAGSGGSGGGSGSSSSGVAIGASVGVDVVGKTVNSTIKDGADIQVQNNVDIKADTTTQNVNVAIAGAFAGGVTADKTAQADANSKPSNPNGTDNQKMDNQGGWMDKVSAILDKIKGEASSQDSKVDNAAGKDIKDNTADSNTQNSLGELGKDKSGEKPDASTLGGGLSPGNTKTTQTSNTQSATGNLSVAAAGSINATALSNKVSASVGNAKIVANNGDVKVNASQKTDMINVSAGLANSKTVGAGAALNFALNLNETTANVGNSTAEAGKKAEIILSSAKDKKLEVKSSENQRNIDVAIGVGRAAQSSSG